MLRAWEIGDLPLVREASSDPGLIAGTTLPDPYTADEGRAFIERQWSRRESGEGISLVIEEVRSSSAVGGATLMIRRAAIADLGYWLIREMRGRGLGGAAVELLVAWALEQADVEAVEAFVAAENHASRRLLEHAEFKERGRRRHAVGRIDEELVVYRRP